MNSDHPKRSASMAFETNNIANEYKSNLSDDEHTTGRLSRVLLRNEHLNRSTSFIQGPIAAPIPNLKFDHSSDQFSIPSEHGGVNVFVHCNPGVSSRHGQHSDLPGELSRPHSSTCFIPQEEYQARLTSISENPPSQAVSIASTVAYSGLIQSTGTTSPCSSLDAVSLYDPYLGNERGPSPYRLVSPLLFDAVSVSPTPQAVLSHRYQPPMSTATNCFDMPNSPDEQNLGDSSPIYVPESPVQLISTSPVYWPSSPDTRRPIDINEPEIVHPKPRRYHRLILDGAFLRS